MRVRCACLQPQVICVHAELCGEAGPDGASQLEIHPAQQRLTLGHDHIAGRVLVVVPRIVPPLRRRGRVLLCLGHHPRALLGARHAYVGDQAGVTGQPEHLCQFGRGWPRLEAALSLIRRWRGVSKLEGAGPKPVGGWFRHDDKRMT